MLMDTKFVESLSLNPMFESSLPAEDLCETFPFNGERRGHRVNVYNSKIPVEKILAHFCPVLLNL